MSKPIILLDPGHGGHDPGAVAYGLEEKTLNLKLALKVAAQLSGARVLMTRERDIYVSLADRVALARRVKPGLFLSLHANAGGGRGFESFIYRGLAPGSASAVIRQALHKAVIAALKPWRIEDRGPKEAAFYVLRHNSGPAVLLESLFIYNRREAAMWQEPSFVETLAAAVARGAQEALGLKPAEEAAAAETERSLYTVQVGAFAYIDNARQRLAEARQAGFSDAYIYQKKHSGEI